MDERERELERRVAQGEPGAEEALEAHRTRMGYVKRPRPPQVSPPIRNKVQKLQGVQFHIADLLPSTDEIVSQDLTPEELISIISRFTEVTIHVSARRLFRTGRYGRHLILAIHFSNGSLQPGNYFGTTGTQPFADELLQRIGTNVADDPQWWLDFFNRIKNADTNLNYFNPNE